MARQGTRPPRARHWACDPSSLRRILATVSRRPEPPSSTRRHRSRRYPGWPGSVGPQACHPADDGFGLVDALLAMSVLLVILIATSNLVSDVIKQAAHSKEQVSATEIA